jgi:hypothetical protein
MIPLLTRNKKEYFYSWEKKIWSTGNNVRLNRDNSGHILTITIDVDLGCERMIKVNFLSLLKNLTAPIYSCEVTVMYTRNWKLPTNMIKDEEYRE